MARVPPFATLRDSISRLEGYPPVMLCLDPGDSTGYAIFEDGNLTSRLGTSATWIPGVPNAIRKLHPDLVVAEDFLLYAHKAKDQSWNKMRTPRLLGAIELVCRDLGIPLQLQSAQDGKSFPTDDKLRAWEFWNSGQRHAMDAVRHGCTYLLFGHPDQWYYTPG